MEEDGSMYEPIVTLPKAYCPMKLAGVSIMMLCPGLGPQLARPQTPEWGPRQGLDRGHARNQRETRALIGRWLPAVTQGKPGMAGGYLSSNVTPAANQRPTSRC